MSRIPSKCDICGKTYTRKYNLTRHKLTHGPSPCLPCHKCHKNFSRSDTLKSHICGGEKNPAFKCEICCKLFSRKGNLKFHKIKCELKKVTTDRAANVDRVEKGLIAKTRVFDETMEYGEITDSVLLKNPKVKEEAIEKNSHQYRALQLYRTKINTERLDMDSVILKPWQTKVLSIIDSLTHRNVIFIVGKNGNEGKTFLQNYIEQFCGSARVYKSKIDGRNQDIGYMMSQDKMIERKDIFLFNVPRSTQPQYIAYDILESIKDGALDSTKYQSKKVTFRTPNCVIVFLNQEPKLKLLSDDRYSVWNIDKSGEKITKKKTPTQSHQETETSHNRTYS